MQFDCLEGHYESLINISDRLKSSLCKSDPETLLQLSEEHRNVMDAIKASGFNRDPKIVQLVAEARRQAVELIEELKEQLNKTGIELKTAGNRKKLFGAYGRRS